MAGLGGDPAALISCSIPDCFWEHRPVRRHHPRQAVQQQAHLTGGADVTLASLWLALLLALFTHGQHSCRTRRAGRLQSEHCRGTVIGWAIRFRAICFCVTPSPAHTSATSRTTAAASTAAARAASSAEAASDGSIWMGGHAYGRGRRGTYIYIHVDFARRAQI